MVMPGATDPDDASASCCACWRKGRGVPSTSGLRSVVPDVAFSHRSLGTGSPGRTARQPRQRQAGDQVLRYSNDSTYEGQLVDGKPHGWGTLFRSDGTLYDGEWRNGELNGEGSEQCPDGTSFAGHYVNGMRSGYGVVKWPEGSQYSGHFELGKANGEGYLLRTDGSVYKGQFRDDCMSGEGCMRWRDGAEYTGQFLANRRDGSGKMVWMSGRWRSYEGEWKDGKQHGQGTVVDQHGSAYSGKFRHGKLMQWIHESGEDDEEHVDLEVPRYWKNQCLTDEFSERTEVSEALQEQIQRILDGTFRQVRTRDRRNGDIPSRLKLLKCTRVENANMWTRYAKAKARVLGRSPEGIKPLESVSGIPGQHFAKTQEFLQGDLEGQLDAQANECFLWHGSTPQGALGISNDGFRIAFAGSHAGTYFGRGCYFAECSSKADEYAKEGDNLYTQIYALLLCRVTCGNVFYITQPDDAAIEAALDTGTYDSVLGDREASVGTYREFVVYEEDLAYPEFVVLYERKFDSGGVSAGPTPL